MLKYMLCANCSGVGSVHVKLWPIICHFRVDQHSTRGSIVVGAIDRSQSPQGPSPSECQKHRYPPPRVGHPLPPIASFSPSEGLQLGQDQGGEVGGDPMGDMLPTQPPGQQSSVTDPPVGMHNDCTTLSPHTRALLGCCLKRGPLTGKGYVPAPLGPALWGEAPPYRQGCGEGHSSSKGEAFTHGRQSELGVVIMQALLDTHLHSQTESHPPWARPLEPLFAL